MGIHINYNDISDLKNKLKNGLDELRKKNSNQLYARTQEISNTIFDYTAELMYGFLSSQSKNVSFQRNLPLEKNSDLFIEGIDAEVKNINDTLNEEVEYKKEKIKGTVYLKEVFHRFLKRITTIHRLGHSDTWGCKCCKQRGDKWFMQQHTCGGQK